MVIRRFPTDTLDFTVDDGEGATTTGMFTNVNDVPTSVVTIDNANLSEGDQLNASHTLADEDVLGSIISFLEIQSFIIIGGRAR